MEDVKSTETRGSDGAAGSHAPRLKSIAERDQRARLGVLSDPDLPVKVVDRIDDAVELVRNRVTYPLQRAASAIALSLLTVVAGAAALALSIIGIFRLASELVSPYEWIIYAAFGVVLLVAGLVFWRKAFYFR